MAQWSEEELAGMSEAEREALLDEEQVDESVEQDAEGDDDEGADDGADDRLAGDDEADDDDDEADDEDEAEGDGEDDEPVDDEGDADEGDDAESTQEPEPQQPEMRLQTEVPDDADQRLAQIGNDMKHLREKFHDGDIDLDEYEAERTKLDDERNDLRMSMRLHEAEVKGRQQAMLNQFYQQRDNFFEQNADLYKTERVKGMFQQIVQEIAAKPENANQTADFFITEADKQLRSDFGIPAPGANEQPEGKRRARKKSARDRANVPPNIGDAPAAEIPETSTSEFAHLEKLSGMELERALAKLTPEQQERYLTE